MVSHLDLPVVADLETMFQLAVTDLGSLWNPTEMSAYRECLDLLARVCPDCTLRWDEPTADDVARMPNNIEATIVGEEVNPTTARTPGVNYTSSVAVRYPPLNRKVNGQWIVGTHSSEGLDVGISWSSGKNFPRSLCMPEGRTSLLLLNLYYMM